MAEKDTNALNRCGLFREISTQDRDKLLGCLGARQVACRKGDIIWRMGDCVTACALILQGQVRAETVSTAGEHALTALHGSGSLVGDVLMATPGGKSPVYVIAARDTRLLMLPYSAIMGGCSSCCDCHRQLRENLIGEIARKYWLQRRRTAYLTTRSLRSRIAMYLLDCAGEQDSFTLSSSREDMAGLLGVNRSAMSRELSRMQQAGFIQYRRSSFRIADRAGLERLTP